MVYDLKQEIRDRINQLILAKERKKLTNVEEPFNIYVICDLYARIKLIQSELIKEAEFRPESIDEAQLRVSNLTNYSYSSLWFLFKVYGIYFFYCTNFPEERCMKIVIQHKDWVETGYVSIE